MKKKLLWAIVKCLLFLAIIVILLSNFSFLGNSPLTKQEIIRYMPIFITFGLTGAIIDYVRK
jgi:hypothetical protein